MGRRSLCGAVLVVAAFGCGRNGPVRVEGKVLLDGQPLKGAMVSFLPEDPGGRAAHGMTVADGSFKLTTTQPDDGAWPGNYKVTVTYSEPVQLAGPAASSQEAMQAFEKAAQEQKKKPPKVVIPAKFSDAGKTVLRQKVPPDAPVSLELTSKP
jgi:hypothetical protein